jgi:hypothetical protein
MLEAELTAPLEGCPEPLLARYGKRVVRLSFLISSLYNVIGIANCESLNNSTSSFEGK